MGEYAKYGGKEIKIGTCESMYYLRASQRFAVTAMRGNVDPVKDATKIRFRFPFPDEDNVSPGGFSGDYQRAIHAPGIQCRKASSTTTCNSRRTQGICVACHALRHTS